LSAPVFQLKRHLFNWIRKKRTGDRVVGFEWLSQPVYQLGLELSQHGAIAYVEAFFFADRGGQDAIVWEHENVLMAPMLSCDCRACSLAPEPRRAAPDALPSFPINEALRRLGVKKNGEVDEFDAVQLGRYRKTEYWAKCTVINRAAKGTFIPAHCPRQHDIPHGAAVVLSTGAPRQLESPLHGGAR
jgi:hypothetical protein